ncbi:MAG: restriction endonuclease [Candidatus Pacebacteria bacterium]|nr:restriction endonuclease [Candidatus Paceibacterota bacterium]
MNILKANGQLEPFDEHKFRRSLRHAHISKEFHDQVVTSVTQSLYEGIPTREIYKHVYDFLNGNFPMGSCTYNLKQAIMELGPSGYPFERYVGKLLERQGYQVRVGQMIRGTCVAHEIDVLAEKDHEHFMVECKFHNERGLKSDVKVALYVWARYQDILQSWLAKEPEEEKEKLHQAWLVTNTKFSEDALQYGQCVGMKMVGWSYPEKGNLQELIEKTCLHPITSLSSLGTSQKQYLLSQDVVIATDLETRQDVVENLHLPSETLTALHKELEMLKTCVLREE